MLWNKIHESSLQVLIQISPRTQNQSPQHCRGNYTTMILRCSGVELSPFMPLKLVIVKKWWVTNGITCTHHHHKKLKWDPNPLQDWRVEWNKIWADPSEFIPTFRGGQPIPTRITHKWHFSTLVDPQPKWTDASKWTSWIPFLNFHYWLYFMSLYITSTSIREIYLKNAMYAHYATKSFTLKFM